MPLVRPCRNHWCPAYATGPDGHCDEHRRPPFGGRADLGPEWPSTRALVLKLAGWRCESCGAPATEVHHWISRADGGTDDLSNLGALCSRCHAHITGRDGGLAAW